MLIRSFNQTQNTFFANVMDSLAEPVFAATLKHNEPGTYDFGFIDSAKYTGDLTYADVDSSQGFWQFTVDGYAVGSDTSSSSFSAIADTGTTLLLVSDDILEKYYENVSGAQNSEQDGGYIFDCDATLPTFSVVIGDYTATVPAEYLNFDTVSGNTCYGGIQSSDGIGFNILGDVFLKSQYVVFNGQDNKIGFAAQA